LTGIAGWVILTSMTRSPAITKIILALSVLLASGLACSLPERLPVFGPTATPSHTPTPLPTLTLTPTPTPPPTPTPVPAARIQTGERALLDGDWDRALLEFESALQSSSDPEIQAAAELGIGRTHLFSSRYEDAAASLENLITSLSDSPQIPYAYFNLGQAYAGLGRYSEAAQAYLNYLTLHSGLVDGYVYEIRADALYAAGDFSSAANNYATAIQSPSLSDSILLGMKMARSYAVAGDLSTALSLYTDLYNRTTNDNTRALILLRQGQAYTSLGNLEAAYAAYQEAVNNYPTSYDSYSALLALVEANVPVNELSRGLVDYFAGQYGVALAAFDRYLQSNPADPGTARYYYGLATRALGGYSGAVTEWDRVIQNYPDHRFWDEAWEQKAYTQWFYLDQYTLAIQTLLDFVQLSPGHPRAAEYLYDAAGIAGRFGRLDQAAQLYERVINEYPNDERAMRALFLAGITRYQMGEYPKALDIFTRQLGLSVSLGDRAMTYLWMSKSLERMGDHASAQANLEQAAVTDPTGYYSERARDLLGGREPFTPPQIYDLAYDLEAERLQADEWMRTTFSLPAELDLSGLGELGSNPSVIRGNELWGLGLYNQARNEFEAVRMAVAQDAVASYRLTHYLVELGLYRSAIFAARQVLDLAGMDDAATMSAPLYFNHIRFGTYFENLILPTAQEYNFNPLFVFSVVRQESLFESFIRSSAAASGLMQIIPATGEEIASNLGWPENYTNDDLNRPYVNIRFGIDYLDSQRNTFKGDMYAALAAYNGGPGNALRWQNLAPNDQDLFVELIDFSETRDYIRRIYEIFSIYRRIYDRTP
jgi:soluble lytic murein transglycosylase